MQAQEYAFCSHLSLSNLPSPALELQSSSKTERLKWEDLQLVFLMTHGLHGGIWSQTFSSLFPAEIVCKFLHIYWIFHSHNQTFCEPLHIFYSTVSNCLVRKLLLETNYYKWWHGLMTMFTLNAVQQVVFFFFFLLKHGN